MDVRQPSRYIFDRHKILIPRYISVLVPLEARTGVFTAREKAGVAFQALKKVEKLHRERFYRLCPFNDIHRFRKHVISINRLMEWKEFHTRDQTLGDQTLGRSAKIPRCVVNFFIDERSYLRYMEEYEKNRLGYLNGPYMEWRKAKKRLDDILTRSVMSDFDRKSCWEWWRKFQSEMWVWEARVDELVLPKWSGIVRELSEIIQDRVDISREWESWT